MKFLALLTLLSLAALTFAAPRTKTVYWPEYEEEELRPIATDFWPPAYAYGFGDHDDDNSDDLSNESDDNIFESNPLSGTLDLSFRASEDMPSLANDTVTNLIFKDLEERIAEDIHRMREDLLLFQRLFGQMPAFPVYFPWAAPEDQPAIIPDGTDDVPGNNPSTFGNNPFFPNNDNNDDDVGNVGGFNLLGGFPFLGIDRPVFPVLPQLPGVGFANPSDFPENYNNETYEVHDVNGTQVAVNNTINKASGDNFNSFFHHQVIHIRPEEQEGEVTEETFEAATTEVPVPASEGPQENAGESDDEVNNVLPEVDNEISSADFSPEAIPEVKPEVNFDSDPELDGSRTETSENNKVLSQKLRKDVSARSLREFNPIIFPADDPNVPEIIFPGSQRAAYIASNSIDDERDYEEIDISDKATKAPDLSNDTRVNRVHANKQGMVQVDPDAEIFNYELVMREAQPRADEN